MSLGSDYLRSLLEEDPERGVYRCKREMFTDPRLFELEMKHIFEGNWVYLAHESQVAGVNDYLTTQIGRQSIVIARNRDGQLNAFINACSHRGAMLCRHKSGNRSSYTCPFHGWTFNNSGKLLKVKDPAEAGYPQGFNCEGSHDLTRVARFESYRGFLFGSLNPDVRPLAEHLGESAKIIDMIVDQSPEGLEVLRGSSSYVYDGNWKLTAENGADGYHVSSVHWNYAATQSQRQQRDAADPLRTMSAAGWARQGGGFYSFEHGHMLLWSRWANPEDRPAFERRAELARDFGEARADWMIENSRNLCLYPNVYLMDQFSSQIRIARPLSATYVWPYQLHASIGPSCALAEVDAQRARVWSGTQNPHDLRNDLARLLQRETGDIEVIRMEAAGCYGRNGADDVSADAVLLAQAVGRPVRVQLMREQEHGWEPKGTAQLIEVRGGLDEQGRVAAYDFATCYPSNGAPTLALLLTGRIPATPQVADMGDRTAIPQYRYPRMRVVANDAAPIVRASWMRGVSALPNVFAHESYVDELAHLAGIDPIAFRRRYLDDQRALALIDALVARAGWQPRTSPNPEARRDGLLKGRGFAYARYFHSKFPGFGAAWAAWIVDVEVNPENGAVRVAKVWVAHDCGQMVNPDGVRHQVHGNVIQSTSRVLKEFATFDRRGVTSLEWGGYPILGFPELPEIDVLLLDRPEQPPMGAGESASVPSAAAIANAIFDATGARLRQVPFTPERVLAALRSAQA